VRVGPRPTLWLLDGPNAKPAQLLDMPASEPSFSPDGRRIFFGGGWVVDRDGSDLRQVVGGLIDQGGMAWSPDGKSIAFAATTQGGDRRQHVYLVSAQGGKLRPVSSDEVSSGPAWTPDGRWLTYSTYAGEINRVHPDGTGAEVIASFPGHEIRDLLWSPDGKHLAYTSRPIHHET
jgi:TolB protein